MIYIAYISLHKSTNIYFSAIKYSHLKMDGNIMKKHFLKFLFLIFDLFLTNNVV